MATKRYRRPQARRESVSVAVLHLLETGEAQAVEPHDLLGLRRLSRNDSALRALWAEHRDEILDDYIDEHPGSRPWGWWKFSAPDPSRRRLGGIGTPAAEVLAYVPEYAYGLPVRWVSIDPDDPPRFESEAAYLDRHNLLSAAERAELDADAFEPETIEAPSNEGA